MTLMELQEILGERIRIASDSTLSVDERRKETELSQTISSLAKQIHGAAAHPTGVRIATRDADMVVSGHWYRESDKGGYGVLA